ncbi:MAG TPA: glycosyltransferase [archaeon]|nr:glycosyltransferase [archaeon]
MKVRFITSKETWRNVGTGKGFFTIKLMGALEKLGVECLTTEKGDSDIDFHISRFHYKSKRCKARVLRLGPVHADTRKNYKYLNYLKQKALKRCEGVVYQSKFSKKFCDKYIGKSKKKTAIIFNGARPEDYNVPPHKSPFKYNYLASTRDWIEMKRLPDIVKAFKLADIEDSCLWICGDHQGQKKKYQADNIIFTGLLKNDDLAPYYRMANAMIHIVWIDASPNSVTEALVAGCPVICGNQGGTHELGCQTVLPDKKWDFKPFNHKKTPAIDVHLLAESLKNYAVDYEDRIEVRAPHLHIDNIAAQYLKFFEEVLNEG